MKIKLPEHIAKQINTLVVSGEFATAQLAVENLLLLALRQRNNRSTARFGYEPPVLSTNELAKEVWRPLPFVGFSQYEVSNLGRVRSLRFGIKPIKLSVQTNGYRQAPVVGDDGKQKLLLVQRLVASAFITPVPGKIDVNHRNGNKADNRASNLEWVSAQENSQHSVKAGLRHWRGTHHRAKISEADVMAIRSAPPEDAIPLSKKYCLSTAQIRNIQNRRSWTHVK